LILRGPDGRDQIIAADSAAVMRAPRFDPSSRWVAWTTGTGATVRELATGVDHPLIGHDGRATAAAFSADGARLATAGADATVRLWDLRAIAREGAPFQAAGASGQPPVLRLPDAASAVVFDPRGDGLITMSATGAVARWALASPPARLVDGHGPHRADLSWWASAEGHALVLHHPADGDVRRLPEVAVAIDATFGPQPVVAFAADQPMVVAALDDGSGVLFWDYARGTQTRVAIAGRVDALAITDDGALAAAMIDQHVIAVRPGAAPTPVAAASGDSRFHDFKLGRDGAWVALAWDDARLVRVADGRVLTAPGRTATFSRDGRWAAIAGNDTALQRCDLRAATCAPLADGLGVGPVAVATDGRIAGAFNDGTIATWRAGATARTRIGRHHGSVYLAAFARDERSLVTIDVSPDVHLWDLASGEGRALRAELGRPSDVFIDDDQVLVSDPHAVHVIADDLPRDEAALRARIAALTP
jgi:WD40 repeat protein